MKKKKELEILLNHIIIQDSIAWLFIAKGEEIIFSTFSLLLSLHLSFFISDVFVTWPRFIICIILDTHTYTNVIDSILATNLPPYLCPLIFSHNYLNFSFKYFFIIVSYMQHFQSFCLRSCLLENDCCHNIKKEYG